MLTRHDLATLSRAHEDELVLSVYIGRDGSDPGDGALWRLRLDAALEALRAEIVRAAPEELAAFDRASISTRSHLEKFGRVLPHEGWAAFVTERGVFHSAALPFAPPYVVRWRQGLYAAPYTRSLKSHHPVVLAVMDRWQARLFSYRGGDLAEISRIDGARPSLDASDVASPSRVSSSSGARGMTRADYAQRVVDDESRRQRKHVVEAILALAGSTAGVVLGGMPQTIVEVRRELEGKLEGRLAEAPELSLESTESELASAVAAAASELTLARQARLLEACKQVPERGSLGWNRTYRALAAGAVDTLMLSRDLIEASPDDAERLVRMALAQGAQVDEIGDEMGTRLWAESDGVAARLRFRIAA